MGMVDNEELKKKSKSLGFYKSKNLKEKSPMRIRWGDRVAGELKDGWLEIDMSMGGEGESEDEEEMDPASKAFKNLDQNRDGSLSREELMPFATGSLDHEMALEQVLD